MKTDSNNQWFKLDNLPVESFIDDIDFIRDNKTRLNWNNISKHKNITKEFIEEFQDFIIWEQIILHRKFSKSYLNKFKNVNWKLVNERVEFIREHRFIDRDYYFKDGWLIIDRDFDLWWDNIITELPDNLKVGGSLYLYNTPITKLPDNLKVGGNLNLYDTEITKLPDNLKVGGYLDLRYTPITELPDNLEVGEDLDIQNTPITKLPDNLKVGGRIYKDF